jgi:hypothetical protein
MSLQDAFDPFRADFEIGSQPYNASDWIHKSTEGRPA